MVAIVLWLSRCRTDCRKLGYMGLRVASSCSTSRAGKSGLKEQELPFSRLAGAGGAGSEDPGEALAEQVLANRLKRCPASPSWPGRLKVQPREARGSAEVGELELY
jgi:hypothetical protein